MLKRRPKNQLVLRRSRDLASLDAYAQFVAGVCGGANALRAAKLGEERARFRPLPSTGFPPPK